MNDISRLLRRGDRLYARLSIGPRVIASGVITGVTDLTELLSRIRKAAAGVSGLALLYLKSLTSGWTVTRPLRLYPPVSEGFVTKAEAFTGPRFPWEY